LKRCLTISICVCLLLVSFSACNFPNRGKSTSTPVQSAAPVNQTPKSTPPAAPVQATATPTLAAITATGPSGIGSATPVPTSALSPGSSGPTVYNLHKGEFPYCLARRFNIHPDDLMRLNGFYYGQIFYPGMRVYIPQSSRPFPGNRALRPHPATYTVQRGDTLFSIACYYGDLDPKLLAQANQLHKPYILWAGRQLTIPGSAETASMLPLSTVAAAAPTWTPVPSPTLTPPPPTLIPPTATQIPPTATLQPIIPSPTRAVPPTATETSAPSPTPTPTLNLPITLPTETGLPERPAGYPSMKLARFDLQAAQTYTPSNINSQISYNIADGAVKSTCASSDDFRVMDKGVYEPLTSGRIFEINTDLSILSCGWSPNEEVQLLIRYPDGKLYSQDLTNLSAESRYASDDGKLLIQYRSYVGEPTGTYVFTFSGLQSHRVIENNFQILVPPGPRARVEYAVPENRVLGYTLYGFKPHEKVRALAYEMREFETSYLVGWLEFETDENGNLYMEIDPKVENIDYQFVGEQSGQTAIIPTSPFGIPITPVLH
jgi:LysM repeat protein